LSSIFNVDFIGPIHILGGTQMINFSPVNCVNIFVSFLVLSRASENVKHRDLPINL